MAKQPNQKSGDSRLRSDVAENETREPRQDAAPSREEVRGSTQAARDDADRGPRVMDDRATTENREISDEERLQALRDSYLQEALPILPKIEGFHILWATTTNPRDTIAMRLRQGYQLIRAEEVPGYEHASLKSGEFNGYIGVNEMVAMKLPVHLFEIYMQELHFDRPNAEQEKLTANIDSLKERAQADDGDIVEFDGNEELRQLPKRRPSFSHLA